MKKTFVMLSATLMLLGAASCDNKNCSAGKGADSDKEEVYTGVMPAADVAGIRYTLRLDYDDDHGYTDGDYDLYETYLQADSTSMTGYRDLKTYTTEGDFRVETGIPSNPNAKYLKLVPKPHESSPGASNETLYFLINPNDSSITMLNSQRELPDSTGLNYTLRMN